MVHSCSLTLDKSARFTCRKKERVKKEVVSTVTLHKGSRLLAHQAWCRGRAVVNWYNNDMLTLICRNRTGFEIFQRTNEPYGNVKWEHIYFTGLVWNLYSNCLTNKKTLNWRKYSLSNHCKNIDANWSNELDLKLKYGNSPIQTPGRD